MDNYLIDDLFYKSGNKAVDDFISNTQINSNSIMDMMEFVPYDQFKGMKSEGKFSEAYKAYKATWIYGNIQGWNKKKINFKRSGFMQVVLKRLSNSDNITSKELNEVPYILI